MLLYYVILVMHHQHDTCRCCAPADQAHSTSTTDPGESTLAAQNTAAGQSTASLAVAAAAETAKTSGIDGSQPLVPHPGMSKASWGRAMGVPVDVSAVMHNPVYSKEYMEAIKPVHVPPKEVSLVAGKTTWGVLRQASLYD